MLKPKSWIVIASIAAILTGAFFASGQTKTERNIDLDLIIARAENVSSEASSSVESEGVVEAKVAEVKVEAQEVVEGIKQEVQTVTNVESPKYENWQPFLEYAKANPIDQKILDKIIANKSYYQADSTCPWQVLGSIHYRETNLGNTNSHNSQGAFQNLSNRYAPNSIVTDWEAQVKQACSHLKGKVKADRLDLTDIELLGKALARYNGCSGQFYTNCGYTMSKAKDNKVYYKCSQDHICLPMVRDNRYGTLAIIAQLLAVNA